MPRWIGWMLDVAREQTPSRGQLVEWLDRSAASGYSLLGLYLEHRFAWNAAPWAVPAGALTREDIQFASAHARRLGVRLVPFLNVLGHMEGFIRAEGGQRLAEEWSTGSQQLCPSRPESVAFVEALADEALETFDDEWVHLGGDEARQLGDCPDCRRRAGELRSELLAARRLDVDERAALYGTHMAAACRRVLAADRRPCLWADMLLAHPAALNLLPRETILFDWQYEQSPLETSGRLRAAGFDVVCCPALHTYDSAWCALDRSFENIDQHAAAAGQVGALGVLVTTWEFACFSSLSAIFPLIEAAGRRIGRHETWPEAIRAAGGDGFAQAAQILGREIPTLSRFLEPSGWRRLRDALVVRQNPFVLWRFWSDEATGGIGDRILEACGRCRACLPAEHPLLAAAELHEVAVQWVRSVEHAARAYRRRSAGECIARLREGAGFLGRLRPWLLAVAASGGSAVDVQRLDGLIAFVGEVGRRVEQVSFTCQVPSEAQRGWRPSFELLCDRGYVAGDMAGWNCGSGLARPYRPARSSSPRNRAGDCAP